MRAAGRVAILLIVAGAAAAVTNAVRPRPLVWTASHDDIYPPPPKNAAKAEISREEAHAALGQGAVFIDAREEERYQNGHIPTAHNLPAESARENVGQAFTWAQPADLVIVYCIGDRCDESNEVFRVLEEAGFTNLRLYKGGWNDWVQAGLPVEGTSE